ncbi:MAG TPA: PDZ domain-containing protein [Gammaproteobacteria bacterium]|nr:PDZ domain-containing protein [Gammaproteobacteria bacterium]
MSWNCLSRRLLLSVFILSSVSAVGAAQAGNTLTRYPTLHGNAVVFEAHGNLWKVARTGGTAVRLTTDPGFDIMPRFSPDGNWIAFTGQYQGNTDVYVIPAAGGTAKRLTFHSDVVDGAPLRWGPDNMVVSWTPDSKNIVFLSRRNTFNSWFGQLFEVPLAGGLPTQLPIPKGGMLSYSPDGQSIAYNRIFRNFRTWKRYTGGLQQDLWLYNFKTTQSTRLTDYVGLDQDPMWSGNTIYFLSDRGAEKHVNLWAYDLNSKQFRQVTHFKDYDIDWPSLGNNGIVFQDGGSLYVLDLPGEQLHELDVTVPDDGTQTNPRFVDAGKFIQAQDTAGNINFDVSPNGKRALLQARGEVFTLPAEHGNTRDLTETSNAEEEYPSWSPDGKWIAYTSDVNGEVQIAVRASEGGAERTLTDFKSGYFYKPVWSPDSSKLAFSDNEHQLWWLDVNSRKLTRVAQDKYNEIHDYAWSPDSRWLTYSLSTDNQMRGIWLYNLADNKATAISSPMDADFNPVFDPDGKYLYFISARHENPTFSQSEFNIATLKMTGIYAATLSKSEASPFAPRSDEGASAHDREPGKNDKKSATAKPVKIDLDGLMQRAVAVPVPADNYYALNATPGHLYYMTTPNFTIEGPLSGETSVLHVFDMQTRKDKTLDSGLNGYVLSADGKTALLNNRGGKFAFLEVSGGDAKPKELDTGHMRIQINPVQEWNEMYAMAWRLERDFFVNQKMNGVDWNAVRAKYGKLLPLMGSREDLNYLIGETIGELSNSHTYVGGGDMNDPVTPVRTGLLGVDFGLNRDSGRYYFKKIYPGDNTRPDFGSPLTEPGIDVRQGDYLLAVDGHALKAPTNPYSLFVNTRGVTVTLTVADNAEGKNKREVTVNTVKDELNLRLHDWIAHNREMVDQLSGGKIGYIYLSDMSALGMEQFIRQFYPQITKQGLILDDRWNGGGFIDQIVLERLRRVLVGMNSNRERIASPIPQQVSDSYKVTLINHYSASDGDIFPYFFRKYGLGPLIGTRTWGGVRGIRGSWPLLDNGYITIPEGTMYGLDSQWVIENHGVEPDMEVDDLPGDVMRGHDAQLDAAVKYLMGKIKAHPLTLPPAPPLLPAYPPPGHE